MGLWIVSAKELILASSCNSTRGLVTSMGVEEGRQLGWQSFQLLSLPQIHWLWWGGVLCYCASILGIDEKHFKQAAWWVRLHSGHCSFSWRVCFHCFWLVEDIWFWFCPIICSLALYWEGHTLSKSVSSWGIRILQIFLANWTGCNPIISFLFATQNVYR